MENELYKIRYTPLAYEDLDSIDSYISETLCNESAAERLLDKIEKAAGQLKQFPRMGSEVEDPYLSAKGIGNWWLTTICFSTSLMTPKRKLSLCASYMAHANTMTFYKQ